MTPPPADPKPPETRWCVRCGARKPLDQEHFSESRGGTEFTHHCKDCGRRAIGRQVAPAQDGRNWS